MSDVLFKLRILLSYLVSTVDEWKLEIWDKDLDSYYCCNGVMCACGGKTIGEQYNDKR
jgi:hypothetical protein